MGVPEIRAEKTKDGGGVVIWTSTRSAVFDRPRYVAICAKFRLSRSVQSDEVDVRVVNGKHG